MFPISVWMEEWVVKTKPQIEVGHKLGDSATLSQGCFIKQMNKIRNKRHKQRNCWNDKAAHNVVYSHTWTEITGCVKLSLSIANTMSKILWYGKKANKKANCVAKCKSVMKTTVLLSDSTALSITSPTSGHCGPVAMQHYIWVREEKTLAHLCT